MSNNNYECRCQLCLLNSLKPIIQKDPWNYPNYIPPNNTGWICPKCGNVYSQTCIECLNCNKEKK